MSKNMYYCVFVVIQWLKYEAKVQGVLEKYIFYLINWEEKLSHLFWKTEAFPANLFLEGIIYFSHT